jgi:SCY1-like protein 1
LPELLKSVEFGGGGPRVLAVVLQIGSKLSAEEYDAQLSPVLVRLFSSPDRALRVYLLDSLSNMITHLPQKIVNDKIFPNLVCSHSAWHCGIHLIKRLKVTGFTDIAPLVREQTVKSILVLITKLSERTINGDLLKYLAKTANDAEPGIRTNTTVCLGKIAKYIGQSVSF